VIRRWWLAKKKRKEAAYSYDQQWLERKCPVSSLLAFLHMMMVAVVVVIG